ncbi:TonB-dependent receptor domain-containing protein [Altererythrobacter sp. GH1-8]|uniref:TonB-dependent receptor domain-containing protein n=1 Tax=Altererythrobacter sp. GH1-8 TaxID=3349333 RepID=UPI00374DD58B
MSTGKRLACLFLLTTALTFPVVASAQDDDQSTPDSAGELEEEAPIEEDEANAPEISVPGGAIIVTGRRVRDVTRGSSQVLSVLTSEDIARTGEGDIAGALTRVTGLSVVGDGRVFVRGLGDRYSLALLNGLPLPSPEPLSRVVPLDIFPTNVVASSLVQKTYSPNYPGEFGGGVINLTTRAVPEESFLKLSTSIGGDSLTAFEEGLTYYGSDLDPFGFDNGNRDIPSNLQTFWNSGERIEDTPIEVQEGIAGQIFPLNLVTLQKDNTLPANFSGSITGGTSFEIGDGTFLGVLATASIKNNWRNRNVRSQQATTDLSTLTEDFKTFITDNNVLVNGLLGFGLDFGENTIRWTNLYIRDTLKTARLSQGTNFVLGETGFDFANQNTAWYERQLIDTQLVGEFEFGDFSLDVRGGYARTDREAPFNATFSYTRTNIPDSPLGSEFVVYLNRQSDTGLTTVSFDDLTEELWFGSIDASYRFSDFLTATIGYAYSDTDRYSVRREYSPRASGDVLEDSLVPFIGLRRPGDIINGASLAGFNVQLDETSQFPAFDAALTIHGAYAMARVNPFDRLTIDFGARFEDAEQTVELDQTIFNTPIIGSTSTNNEEDYILPAITVTWEATDSLQLRASGSKTIARPQFRELVEQLYFDPESNRAFRGNPFLVDSELTNLEGRAEYYPGGTDRVSIAGFYKKIDKPIEAFITSTAGSLLTSFANAPEATLYGAEVEAVRGIDLYDWGGFFETKRLLLIGNYTYTQSDIAVAEGDTTLIPGSGVTVASQLFVDGAPLTGQSDHLVNLQIGLEDTEKLQQLTLLLNYASKRVTSRGFQRPDVVEDPGLTIDFVARSAINLFGRPFEIDFEVRNIFGRDNFEYQSNSENRIEINSYRVGTSVSFGISTEF